MVTSLVVRIRKWEMAAKRRKTLKNQISQQIISMGYEIEIQEF
jgi:hypothetical protein